jgi:hypothetical protein
MDNESPSRLIASADLREYFHHSLGDELDKQGIDAGVETIAYLVNLLAAFQRSDRLYQYDGGRMAMRPLALLYADALNDRSIEQRHRLLQQLGDVALFVAGVFSESLSRKLVDLDYYIAMGSGAYGYLSESMRRTCKETLCDTFGELSIKFGEFVDVLSGIREGAPAPRDRDLLRLYEIWLRTGSEHARNRLREAGIEPGAAICSVIGRTEH